MAKLPRKAERLIRAAGISRKNAAYSWTDGLLLGNGNIGATGYGDRAIEWIINKVDLYPAVVENEYFMPHKEVMEHIKASNQKNTVFLKDIEPHDEISSTISAVNIRLKTWEGFGWYVPALPLFSQELSIYDGELLSKMDKSGMHVEVTSIVPRGRNIFAFSIEETDERKHGFVMEVLRPVNENFDAPEWFMEENILAFTQKLPGEDASYAVAIAVAGPEQPAIRKSKTGISYRTIGIYSGSRVFVAVRTTRECSDPLGEAMTEAKSCAAESFEKLRSENRNWWHEYWNNAWADFSGEKRINNYFYFSLYELACSFGKAPMPGLNGLSYGPVDVISTGANIQHYTHDQNAQIPLMPLMPLNRYKLISVAADTYLAVADRLREDTKKIFGCDGIRLPVCMKQDGREYSVCWYRYTLCGSAYTGFMLALAWKYSRDAKLMKEKLLPLLREFVRFYAGMMQKDTKGTYHFDYSVPPEIFTVTKDDTCTIALLKPCIEAVLEAHRLFNTEDETEAALWQDILDNYPSLSRRPDGGWWCGPDIPFEHYMFGGHLFYPFFPTAVDTDENAARKTLEYAEKSGVETSHMDFPGSFHMYHGWAAYNFTASAIRLKDRKLGWNGMKRFLDLFAKPNGLFMHNAALETVDITTTELAFSEAPSSTVLNYDGKFKQTKFNYEDATANTETRQITPPVIEGSSAFLLMAAETLLQSWGGIIRLFPCVPDDFTGSFHGFLAEGGFIVSAEMKKGRLTKASVTAKEAGPFKLEYKNTVITAALEKGCTFKVPIKDGNIMKDTF